MSSADTMDARAALVARANLYRLVSRLLAGEVDTDMYRRLVAMDDGLDAPGSGWVDARIRDLDERSAVAELAVEYCRLFIGPDPRCLPYASAHDHGANLRGRSERRFARFLADHQLEVSSRTDRTLLGLDHLAVQLAVLDHLYRCVSGVAPASLPFDAARSAIRILVHDHLLPWAPTVANRLTEQARLAPYTTIGAILVSLLHEEATTTATP